MDDRVGPPGGLQKRNYSVLRLDFQIRFCHLLSLNHKETHCRIKDNLEDFHFMFLSFMLLPPPPSLPSADLSTPAETG